jgi:cytochrome c-type biogenesis protein CcmH
MAGCGAVLRASAAQAQEAAQTMSGPMNDAAYRPVRLPARPGAEPLLDDDAIKSLESGLKCQCGCNRDIYNCRTTDFSCRLSPAMHRDVLALVSGGYNASEITEAFVDVYGESVRMAPRATGFNVIAYVAPYFAVGTAGLLVAAWIKKSLARQRAITESPAINVTANATPEELRRLEKALKED